MLRLSFIIERENYYAVCFCKIQSCLNISSIKNDGDLSIDSKVLNPSVVGKRRRDKVFDSKMMTLGMERNTMKQKGNLGSDNWVSGFIFFHFFRYKTPQRFGNLFVDPR